AEADLHRIAAGPADGLADEVHERHRAGLVPDGIDVRQIVTDYTEVKGVGVQTGQACRERTYRHDEMPPGKLTLSTSSPAARTPAAPRLWRCRSAAPAN